MIVKLQTLCVLIVVKSALLFSSSQSEVPASTLDEDLDKRSSLLKNESKELGNDTALAPNTETDLHMSDQCLFVVDWNGTDTVTQLLYFPSQQNGMAKSRQLTDVVAEWPRPRHRAQIAQPDETASNGDLYLIGGGFFDWHQWQVDVYNARSNSWRRGPDLPVTRRQPTVVTTDHGEILVCGCTENSQAHCRRSCDVLDPARHQMWRTEFIVTNVDDQCMNLNAAVMHKNKMVISGGRCAYYASGVATVNQYDFGVKIWTRLANMRQWRYQHSMVTDRRRYIYVCGGEAYDYKMIDLHRLLYVCERYDDRLDVWQDVADMPRPRRAGSQLAFSPDLQFLMVIGGYSTPLSSTDSASALIDVYDTHTDTWETSNQTLVRPSAQHTLTVVDRSWFEFEFDELLLHSLESELETTTRATELTTSTSFARVDQSSVHSLSKLHKNVMSIFKLFM